MNSDLHLFNQLFEEGEDPSFHLAPSLPSLQELFADWLDLFLQAWELPTHTAALGGMKDPPLLQKAD